MAMLDEAGVSFQVVMTKVDKAEAGELARVAEQVAGELTAHAAALPELTLTSAVERRGIAELHETLGAFAPRIA